MQNSAELDKARALAVEDPEILSGTPVIRNTRIPVYEVAASVAAGVPIDRVLAAYSGLTAEMAKLAALYAGPTQNEGGLDQHTSVPAGALIVSRRRTPRGKAHEAAH